MQAILYHKSWNIIDKSGLKYGKIFLKSWTYVKGPISNVITVIPKITYGDGVRHIGLLICPMHQN